jgi:hypothetical protein
VQAEDGDKGFPRELRYGIVSEGNPFTPFFDIDEKTGKQFYDYFCAGQPLKYLLWYGFGR